MTRVLVRWRHWSGYRDGEYGNCDSQSVQQKITASDCDTICDNEDDEELTEDV